MGLSSCSMQVDGTTVRHSVPLVRQRGSTEKQAQNRRQCTQTTWASPRELALCRHRGAQQQQQQQQQPEHQKQRLELNRRGLLSGALPAAVAALTWQNGLRMTRSEAYENFGQDFGERFCDYSKTVKAQSSRCTLSPANATRAARRERC